MNVELKKTYIVYTDSNLSSTNFVVNGKDLEVENGNCRMLKGDKTVFSHAVFTDVMKLYDEGGFIEWYYGDRDHDKQFPTQCYRLYKTGSFGREVYIAYWKIEELTMPVHENRKEAELDAAKERLPQIIEKRDRLKVKREEELAKPWYKRIFSHSSKKELASVEEMIEVYEKNMNV